MKLFYFILFAVALYSCSNNLEHSYSDFKEFNKANLRLKGWFPELVAEDAYNLKEIHTIGNIESYGRFSYKNNIRMDSLLSLTKTYSEVDIDTLNNFLGKFKDLKSPSWFLDKEKLSDNKVYRNGSMYLIKNDREKTIYFAYTMK